MSIFWGFFHRPQYEAQSLQGLRIRRLSVWMHPALLYTQMYGSAASPYTLCMDAPLIYTPRCMDEPITVRRLYTADVWMRLVYPLYAWRKGAPPCIK